MFTRGKALFIVALAAVLALTGSVGAFAGLDEGEMNADADAAIVAFKADHPKAEEIVDASKGMLVCPSQKKVGFVVGLERGSCAMRVDGKTTEYYKASSASWGLQAGAAGHSMVMVFNDAGALANFRKKGRKSEIGTNVSVTIANKGAEIDLSKLMSEPVVAFVFGETGLMYDLSLEGTTFKQVTPEEVFGTLVEVTATADISGSQARGAQAQMKIGIDRFVTDAERGDMIKVLRGEMDPMEREACGALHFKGAEPVAMEYAYAHKLDNGKYMLTLGTSADMPFTAAWPQAKAANSDLKIIQMTIDGNHVGSGVMVLGGMLSWDEGAGRVELDTGKARPITLSSVSATDLQ